MLPDRFVDTRPLRTSPAFRRLWIGTTAAGFSGQLAATAVLFQVWELTRSPWWSGAIGLATAVPTILGGLIGGTLADTLDRRRLVLATTAVTAVAAAGLATQAGLDNASVLLVLALVMTQTAATALGAPARRTFIARLLPTNLVPAGVALNHVSFQIAMLAGPALAGVLLATGGLRAAYLADAAGIAVSLYGVLRLPSMRPRPPVEFRAEHRSKHRTAYDVGTRNPGGTAGHRARLALPRETLRTARLSAHRPGRHRPGHAHRLVPRHQRRTVWWQ